MLYKGLFLDRDGILNETILRDGLISSPRHMEEFRIYPEYIPLLEKAHLQEMRIFVVTNQPDIARGLLSIEELEKMHSYILQSFPIDELMFCPSADDENFFRKPNPGMLLYLAKKWQIDLEKSYFIGDSRKDILAGKKAGVTSILYETAYNRSIHGIGDFNFSSLSEISDFLFSTR